MRKLKLQVQMTLDGFVAGPNGELVPIAIGRMWIGKRDEAILDDVVKLADTCDTPLLGRKMTREFIDYWESRWLSGVLDNQAYFASLSTTQ